MAKRNEARAYFLAHIGDQTDECMVWPFSTSRGYGQLWIGGRNRRVHTLACEAHQGPRPPRTVAAHGPCHDRRCWNGRHLSWATSRANTLDRHRDGSARCLLTAQQVVQIREAYAAGGVTQQSLSAAYGVSRSMIGHVVTGRYWSHVE